MSNFTHLKLWVAVARHNFRCAKLLNFIIQPFEVKSGNPHVFNLFYEHDKSVIGKKMCAKIIINVWF